MLAALAVASVLGAEVEARAEELERGSYAHFVGAVAVGKSLRFNNPFRLAEPLGKTAESVSTGATYLDVAVAALFGPAWGLQQGPWLHWSSSLSGVAQGVLTPSYALLFRGDGGLLPYARVGLPIVTGPDPNVGGEAAGGLLLMLSGGLGLTAEIGGAAFYGAATREVSATLVPLLYGQAGLAFDWEALP